MCTFVLVKQVNLSTCRCCSALSPRAASLICLKRSSKLAMLRAIPPVDDSNGKCAEVSRLFRSAAAKKAGESGSGTLNPDTSQQLTATTVLAYWYKNSKKISEKKVPSRTAFAMSRPRRHMRWQTCGSCGSVASIGLRKSPSAPTCRYTRFAPRAVGLEELGLLYLDASAARPAALTSASGAVGRHRST
jgi:hypothetical protein